MTVSIYQLAKELVDYIIEHWDDYVANIYHRDTIKLTKKHIIEIICTKYPEKCKVVKERRFYVNGVLSILYGIMDYEFRLRGFKVKKEKIGGDRTALYVSK